MSEQDQKLLYQQIIAKFWADEEFKASLLANPRAVLADEGLIVPEGKKISVLVGTEEMLVFHIPHLNLELTEDAEVDGQHGEHPHRPVISHWP